MFIMHKDRIRALVTVNSTTVVDEFTAFWTIGPRRKVCVFSTASEFIQRGVICAL